MGAALLLSLIFLGALQRPLPLSKRVHGLLQTTGGAAARAVLLLYPPAARDALALLNCSPVAVSPSGCISLNGCSGSSSVGSSNDRSRTVTVRVLASNPFYVCWAPGASHVTAGGLAVAVLIVVVLAFPLFSYVVLWRSAGRETSLQQRMITRGGRGGLETAGSAMVDNPLLLLSLGPSASMRSKQNSSHRHSAPIKSPVAPFLSDYRPDAWYMRHADLALTLLLACLQVSLGQLEGSIIYHRSVLRCWYLLLHKCRPLYRPPHPTSCW